MLFRVLDATMLITTFVCITKQTRKQTQKVLSQFLTYLGMDWLEPGAQHSNRLHDNHGFTAILRSCGRGRCWVTNCNFPCG